MNKAIKKMDPFVIWGDGKPIREYIYAKDVARGMIMAMEKYCNAEPINLASGEYHSMEDLARKIIKIVGYNPKIVFDKTKPSGQKRRVLSNSKAAKEFGFKSETLLEEGMTKTLKWYQDILGLDTTNDKFFMAVNYNVYSKLEPKFINYRKFNIITIMGDCY